MTPTVGTQVFWMIAIGLVIGFVGFYVFRRRGIKLMPSIVVGTAGAVIVGLIAVFLDLDVPMVYPILGAIGFLFVTNAFHKKDTGPRQEL